MNVHFLGLQQNNALTSVSIDNFKIRRFQIEFGISEKNTKTKGVRNTSMQANTNLIVYNFVNW